MAAITNSYRRLSQRSSFVHCSVGWKSQDKMWPGCVSHVFLPSLPCRWCLPVSSHGLLLIMFPKCFLRTLVMLGYRTPMTSFYLSYPFKVCCFLGHSLRCLSLRLWFLKFGWRTWEGKPSAHVLPTVCLPSISFFHIFLDLLVVPYLRMRLLTTDWI